MKKFLLGFAVAAVFVFAACQQPTDGDDSNVWDITHSYGENRLAGNTVYPAGTNETDALIKYEFSGNTYKISDRLGAPADWILSEEGTYVTNGYTRSVDFYRTRRNPLVFVNLKDYAPFILDQNVIGSLLGKAGDVDSNGLVDEVAIIDIVAGYFTTPGGLIQYAKLPETPWNNISHLNDLEATEQEVEAWWNDQLALSGYKDRAAYVRDHFIQLKASPTAPTDSMGYSLKTPPTYSLASGKPYL
jgi:hypothetical protein